MSENSPLLPRASQYGRPSFIDKIKMFFSLATSLPVLIVWTYLSKSSATKSKRRLVFDRILKRIVTTLNIRQLQYLFGTTRGQYLSWCKKKRLEPIIEDIEGAKLLWIGERGLDKVIVYLHGGGFVAPASSANFELVNYIRTTLRERGVNLSVMMVEYTLVPEAAFPTPLRQTVTAINHLMNLGVDPQNMQLIGDSAGGNLILQVLGHLLHPLESENVPALSLPAPLKGTYLISPWVDLSDIFQTLSSGDRTDYVDAKTLKYWGSAVLGPVPAKYRDYIEANSAADDWWKGVDAFVDRVLISAGEGESLKNEIIRFHSTFDNFHSHAKLVLDPGVHDEPVYDFAVGDTDGELTNTMLDWLTIGFQEPTS